MNVQGYVAPTLVVTLSKSNLDDLVTLYALFERREALPYLQRKCENGTFLRVVIEPDEQHYKDREKGPGAALVIQGSSEDPN